MSTEGDRRAQGATRIPFEALVEVGGALGPSFEAQAVNISEDGMQLRTAYLPEAGQPLTCRFDAGPGQSVLASGEVVWAEQAGKGGEFAIRFTDMDPESVDVLRRMCGVASDEEAPVAAATVAGSKVRLHIEGLASPMRARVKDAHSAEVTVGSDLGFLQVGKELELEDADSGTKRPAKIDRVDVIVDKDSHIPQLVVTLRYAEADAEGVEQEAESDAAEEAHAEDVAAPRAEAPAMAMASHGSDEDAESVKMAGQMKGALARGVSAIGPTFAKLAKRAKTTVALIAAKRGERGERGEGRDDAAMPRRTTAPAPGGGLHTAGRRVIRGEANDAQSEETTMDGKPKFPKRKVAIAGAVAMALVIGVVAMRKPSSPVPNANAQEASTSESRPMAMPKLESVPANLGAPPATQVAPALPPPAPMAAPMQPMEMGAGSPLAANDKGDKNGKGSKKGGKVTPFGNGPVSHGNLLRLKMDGPIEAIQGAAQPTGFTVKLPNRKSIEAAGPLATRDSRIASIKVTNDGAGAELTVTFKDGVPNYQVRAKGDMLEIALAPLGKPKAEKTAKKDGEKKGHGAIAKKGDKAGAAKGDKADRADKADKGDKTPDKH